MKGMTMNTEKGTTRKMSARVRRNWRWGRRGRRRRVRQVSGEEELTVKQKLLYGTISSRHLINSKHMHKN